MRFARISCCSLRQHQATIAGAPGPASPGGDASFDVELVLELLELDPPDDALDLLGVVALDGLGQF
jgi:hypothetical protein